jgi:hypothetical protein
MALKSLTSKYKRRILTLNYKCLLIYLKKNFLHSIFYKFYYLIRLEYKKFILDPKRL